ncbi:hypothetical protein A6V37_01025 [Paraburkholderia ginsengiterrae]|uniref:Uncharacterized protein n=1 Tax=Paraburkholderia ginsengiterrae TaxID=1462993 RepID=A0A1A9NBN4_9BURK|nr:hypothetical protein A6V37_01025 [Paraburkholderia ginsengiterrae]
MSRAGHHQRQIPFCAPLRSFREAFGAVARSTSVPVLHAKATRICSLEVTKVTYLTTERLQRHPREHRADPRETITAMFDRDEKLEIEQR